MQNNNQQPTKPDAPLFDRVATIPKQARANVVRSVNSEITIAYWLVGRYKIAAKVVGIFGNDAMKIIEVSV
jgi:hypothetical protein